MSSSEEELEVPTDMSLVEKINNLEKFAIGQFSKLKGETQRVHDSISDMAAVRAELSALKSRLDVQEQHIAQLRRELEETSPSSASHSGVQRKRPAPSPDRRTPEQKRSCPEELDKILEPFWPEKSDARERLTERQQAFFNYMIDQLKVRDRRNIEHSAATVISEGVSRGVWQQDWAPEAIKTSFQKYLEKRITKHLTNSLMRDYQQKETERLSKLVGV